jgi:hypothetical protein
VVDVGVEDLSLFSSFFMVMTCILAHRISGVEGDEVLVVLDPAKGAWVRVQDEVQAPSETFKIDTTLNAMCPSIQETNLIYIGDHTRAPGERLFADLDRSLVWPRSHVPLLGRVKIHDI